jgi:hypothetical protein
VGTRMMGKVDAVPGVGHVATKFYLQCRAAHSRGDPIWSRGRRANSRRPNSFQSQIHFVIAWLRTGFVIAAIVLIIVGIIAISMPSGRRSDVLSWEPGSCVGALIYCITLGRYAGRATIAMDPARRANLGPELPALKSPMAA